MEYEQSDCLDSLLRIRIEGPPLEQWTSENAVKLWWGDKTRRVNRSEPSTSSGVSSSQVASQSEPPTWTLDDWDTWLDSD